MTRSGSAFTWHQITLLHVIDFYHVIMVAQLPRWSARAGGVTKQRTNTCNLRVFDR